MVSVDEIEKEILELERRDSSWTNVEHLAWLYTVYDHLKAPTAEETTGDLTGGEFVQACSGVGLQRLLNILAEHMEGIKVIYPKEYSAILEKIKAIKE